MTINICRNFNTFKKQQHKSLMNHKRIDKLYVIKFAKINKSLK